MVVTAFELELKGLAEDAQGVVICLFMFAVEADGFLSHVVSFLVDIDGFEAIDCETANTSYGLVLCVESAESWPSFRRSTGAED